MSGERDFEADLMWCMKFPLEQCPFPEGSFEYTACEGWPAALLEIRRLCAELLRWIGECGEANVTAACLREAIRKHRDYRGDYRCHLDDGELYAVLPEGDTRPARDVAVTIENCQRFIDCRQQGREYVSPQDEIDRLRDKAKSKDEEVSRLRADLEHWKKSYSQLEMLYTES